MTSPSTQDTLQDTAAPTTSPAAVGFDITTRVMRDRVEVTLTDPLQPGKHVDTGGRITILSPRSREASRAARASAKPITVEDDRITSSEDDFADNLVDQTIGVTVAWNLTNGGAPIPCTPETVRALYTSPASAWIQGQVQAAYLNTASFFDAARTA